ncbi:hypothetical protein HFRIS_019995 [Herbaspirillum frisingense GSF30]|uniref:PLD phosphodiesterase domain-containing protein n=1 Tax=Herbaspirillum frisingense GSF30 TaxID=864073 RepID=A0AAI9IBH8_9BURK|nr:hypothetical protein [Herbaspirillum frisingense]EOA02929.1 hypothetical protein HFRIS_019995 [Herbaspirillum frisingense GSF30]
MKLLEQLREQVASLGEIRRAWFTSFNLNIPFFETHLLSALLGTDTPANRLDYENMQWMLADSKMDARIFCDARMLEADQLKRTAIPIHGILPQRLGRKVFQSKSIFHPKVILLEDKQGRMVLGAGSANLSVDGWGRNQEVFRFLPVCTSQQRDQIAAFFSPLSEAAGLGPFEKFKAIYHGEDDAWRFVHSFQDKVFLQQLTAGLTVQRLSVWSPYFSRDLPALLDKLRPVVGEQAVFSLVPDRRENHYVPTRWTPRIAELQEPSDRQDQQEVLSFHARPTARDARTDFTHAKIWLASSGKQARMAVGSWNFTGRGCASLDCRNIEAGIVFDVNARTDITGARELLQSDAFSDNAALDADALDLQDYPLPFDLFVVYDWEKCAYAITGKCDRRFDAGVYTLRLPGVSKRQSLYSMTNLRGDTIPLAALALEPDDDGVLLADHSYEVWQGGEMRYRGLIQEVNVKYRRGQGYDSLKDLLNDLVDGADPERSSNTRLREALRHQPVPGEEETWVPPAVDSQGMSYFRLFHAFAQFRARLAAPSRAALEHMLFVSPGCLQELVSKVDEQIKQDGNAVFNWFLLQETHALYRAACAAYDATREKYQSKAPPDNYRWRSLWLDPHSVRLPRELGRKPTMKQILDVCNYEA